MISSVYELPWTMSLGTFQVKVPLLARLEAMIWPSSRLPFAPERRFRVTVEPARLDQVNVDDWPACKR